ncbi:MAG: YggS family pyridoxal phosphate-dependent enzyme [Magnetococcales bacterium]|nr:YggS family pyridoxal phosphate-dependent enzyme [Magnetococcales bacterium]
MSHIVSTLATLRETMAEACQRAGRRPESVQLLAVSKTQPAGMVNQAAMAGQRMFGENRVQEAREKIPLVQQTGLHWHLIGPLQRNKVKLAVQWFEMIQSVDSVDLAREIDRRMAPDRIMPILLQVNVGGEVQKSGLAPQALEPALLEIAQLPRLSVQGLMTVPPYEEDPRSTRPYFRQLANLARAMTALSIPGVSMETLSMGMSHDFEVAIEEGATMVRIGSSLFGTRDG